MSTKKLHKHSTKLNKPKLNKPSSCHKLTEIIPGLFLADKRRQKEMVRNGIDVLVPLASVDTDIWEWGFRGKVHAIPIPDGGVLPLELLKRAVDELLEMLADGQRLAIYCVGGHGRTGYIASAVIGSLYPELDPVSHVRQKYCDMAVETNSQITQLEQFLGVVLPHKPSYDYLGTGLWWGGWDFIRCDMCSTYTTLPCSFTHCPVPFPDELVGVKHNHSAKQQKAKGVAADDRSGPDPSQP